MADTRIVRPFITDADDIYSFDSITKMKSEIKAILGFDLKKIIRVNRFKESDVKGKMHWRILSDTNDGSGEEVEVNLSNNPKVPLIVTKYANLVKGSTYLDEQDKLCYWNGTESVIIPKEASLPKILQSDTDPQIINWKKIPVIIENETSLTTFTDIKDGDVFLMMKKPVGTNSGDFFLYFASTELPSTYPNNPEITTGTTGIHVYKIVPSGSATTKGTVNSTTGVVDLDPDKILMSDALIEAQKLMIKANQKTTNIKDKSVDKFHPASVTGLMNEKIDAVSKLVANPNIGVINFVDKNGSKQTYYATKRTVFEFETDGEMLRGSLDGSNFVIPFDSDEDIEVFKKLATYNVTVKVIDDPDHHFGANVASIRGVYLSYRSILANDGKTIVIYGDCNIGGTGETLKLLFTIDVLHGYKLQP